MLLERLLGRLLERLQPLLWPLEGQLAKRPVLPRDSVDQEDFDHVAGREGREDVVDLIKKEGQKQQQQRDQRCQNSTQTSVRTWADDVGRPALVGQPNFQNPFPC